VTGKPISDVASLDLDSLESYHRFFLMRMLLPRYLVTSDRVARAYRVHLQDEADRLAALIIERRRKENGQPKD